MLQIQKENTHNKFLSIMCTARQLLLSLGLAPAVHCAVSCGQSVIHVEGDNGCLKKKKKNKKKKAQSVLQSVVLQLTTKCYTDWAGAGTQSQDPEGKITSPWTCCHFCPPGS